MPATPDLITELDFSVAELHAAKLDGLLLPVGGAFRCIDRPDGQRERCAAIAREVPDRMTVGEESAAWLWGALVEAPEPLRLSSQPRHRARLPPSAGRITREVRIADHELVRIPLPGRAAMTVTAPLRTAVDLARAAGRPSAAAALRGLVSAGVVTADEVRSAIIEQRRHAGQAAAIAAVDRAESGARPVGVTAEVVAAAVSRC